MADEPRVMSTGERLIYMANQIARNFEAEGLEKAATLVENHIRSFWDPAMRQRIVMLAEQSPAALSPVASAAIARIAEA